MAIKVITIDFWNTLFDSSNGSLRNAYRQRALIEEMDKFNIMIKHDAFTEALKASWEYFDNIWKNEQRTPSPVDTVTFFWNYLKLPDYPDSIKIIVEKFANSILHYPPSLIEGAREALQILHQDYDLAIISDTGFSPGTVLCELLDRFDILHYFKAFSFSDETGVSKPHERAFLTVLEQFNCHPKYAIHIGDIENTDILGAKKIGMKAIKFTGDPTSKIANENSNETIADAEANSWSDVLKSIESINRMVKLYIN